MLPLVSSSTVWPGCSSPERSASSMMRSASGFTEDDRAAIWNLWRFLVYGGDVSKAMALMLEQHPMYALHFEGRRHDIGNKLDFIKTNVTFGLMHDELRGDIAEYLKALVATL